MNIYLNPTYEVSNKHELNIVKKLEGEKNINVLHPFKSLIWQGPLYVQEMDKLIKEKNIHFISETFNNLGFTLHLIDLGINKVSITSSIDNALKKKICSIAKKKKVKILYTEMFSEKFNLFEV